MYIHVFVLCQMTCFRVHQIHLLGRSFFVFLLSSALLFIYIPSLQFLLFTFTPPFAMLSFSQRFYTTLFSSPPFLLSFIKRVFNFGQTTCNSSTSRSYPSSYLTVNLSFVSLPCFFKGFQSSFIRFGLTACWWNFFRRNLLGRHFFNFVQGRWSRFLSLSLRIAVNAARNEFTTSHKKVCQMQTSTCRDEILKNQPNKTGTTPQYFYTIPTSCAILPKLCVCICLLVVCRRGLSCRWKGVAWVCCA